METDKKNVSKLFIACMFNWLIITNIPFLQDINILLYIEIFFLAVLAKNMVTCHYQKNYIYILLYVISVLFISLFTKSLSDRLMLDTIFSLLIIMYYFNDSSCQQKESLLKIIYISINILSMISLIGILIAKYTRVLNSTNDMIRSSFGNFINGNRFYGILNSCNTLGPLAGTSCILAINYMLKGLKKECKTDFFNMSTHVAFFLINAYILVGTHSITAFVSTLAAMLAYFLLAINKHRKLVVLVLLIVCILFSVLILSNTENLPSVFQRDWTTASGRTRIWKEAIELIKIHPFRGYGAKANYIAAAKERGLNSILTQNTHNMLVEVIIRHGIISGLLYLLSFMYPFFYLIYLYFKDYSFSDDLMRLSFSFLIFMMIHSQFEAMFLFNETPMMVVFQFFYVGCYNYIGTVPKAGKAKTRLIMDSCR